MAPKAGFEPALDSKSSNITISYKKIARPETVLKRFLASSKGYEIPKYLDNQILRIYIGMLPVTAHN